MRFAAMVASRTVAEWHLVAIPRAKRPQASQRANLQAAEIVVAVSEVGNPSARQMELVLVVVALA